MLHAPLALSLSLPLFLCLSFSKTIAANFPQRALSAKKLHKAEAREFFPHFPANFPAAAKLKRVSDLLGQVSKQRASATISESTRPKLAKNTFNCSQF